MGRKFFFSLFTFGRVLYSLQPSGKGQAVVFFFEKPPPESLPPLSVSFSFPPYGGILRN